MAEAPAANVKSKQLYTFYETGQILTRTFLTFFLLYREQNEPESAYDVL